MKFFLNLFSSRKNKTLVILRGHSSAGKTSLAELLGLRLIEMDQHPNRKNPDGTYRYVPSENKEIAQWCFNQVKTALARGESVAVANTFLKVKYMQPYLDLAARYGCVVRIIHCEGVLLPSRAEARNGICNDGLIQQMKDKFECFGTSDDAHTITLKVTQGFAEALALSSEVDNITPCHCLTCRAIADIEEVREKDECPNCGSADFTIGRLDIPGIYPE